MFREIIEEMFAIHVVRVLCLAMLAWVSVGCGFDFSKRFADSTDLATDTGGVGDTDGDTDTDTDTDTDADTDTEPLPDFSLVGFAAVDPGTTGGEGGSVVEVSTYADLKNYLEMDEAYIVRVVGTISLDAKIEVHSNKTLEGVGSLGGITGESIRLTDAVSNIIIRNLTFAGSIADALTIENSAHHVWVDHNDFSNSGDGLVDIGRGASYVTVSWNYFHDQDMVCLIGGSDNQGEMDIGNLKVTLHHNWFERTKEQHPRCRFGEMHVFNNYYANLDATGYAVAATMDARVLSEANSFVNVAMPFAIGYGSSGPGTLVSLNDRFENCGDPSTAGEAFDPSDYYAYSPDAAKWIASMVPTYAGVGMLGL